MAVSKKIITKNSIIWRYSFGLSLIIIGIALNSLGLGQHEFFSYNTVGGYLIFCGILILSLATLIFFRKKNKIIDERAEKIGSKAMAWVWYFMFVGGFSIMIIDGILPLNLSISSFVSYSICALLLVYLIAYKIIEKRI